MALLKSKRERGEGAIEPATVIFTVAGNGVFGFAGDGGPGASASLALPRRIALDPEGNLLVADVGNHRIRRVDASTGIINTIAGNGSRGFCGDNGPAIDACLFRPTDVACDAEGNIYIADQENNRIRRIDRSTGTITTVAGNGKKGFSGDGGPAPSAQLNSPGSVAVDAAGNLFISDRDNHRIRRVAADTGVIATVAGNGEFGFNGDRGPAVQATLTFPRGVAVDGAGNVYIADVGNNRIRRVDSDTGTITTVAGNGQNGFGGDGGPAGEARLSFPISIQVDGEGNVYIPDRFNHRLRKVDAQTGVIRTITGSGVCGFGGDKGPATEAILAFPSGIAIDRFGRVLIADLQNQRVRCVETALQALLDLVDQVERLNRSAGATSRREGKAAAIQKVLQAVQEGESQLAFRLLSEFMEVVESQRGGELTGTEADLLVSRASLVPSILTQDSLPMVEAG